MIVDSSAAVAILKREPVGPAVEAALTTAAQAFMSAGTLIELHIVLGNRAGAGAATIIDQFLVDMEIEIVAVDEATARRATSGWRRFGKGRHPAALNFGDCFTYALASLMHLPVLCVGNDFAQTDVQVVPLDE